MCKAPWKTVCANWDRVSLKSPPTVAKFPVGRQLPLASTEVSTATRRAMRKDLMRLQLFSSIGATVSDW
jgi:hypothetical protein